MRFNRQRTTRIKCASFVTPVYLVFAPVTLTLTLTLTRWLWYTKITWIFWRCTHMPEMNFQKLEHEQDRQSMQANRQYRNRRERTNETPSVRAFWLERQSDNNSYRHPCAVELGYNVLHDTCSREGDSLRVGTDHDRSSSSYPLRAGAVISNITSPGKLVSARSTWKPLERSASHCVIAAAAAAATADDNNEADVVLYTVTDIEATRKLLSFRHFNDAISGCAVLKSTERSSFTSEFSTSPISWE